MIGALALVFGGVEAGFVGFVWIRSGQICRVGDMVGDTVPRNRIGDRVSAAPAGAGLETRDTISLSPVRS
jgi:hypothetical protein